MSCSDTKGWGSAEEGEINADFNDMEIGLGLVNECWEERGIGSWAEGLANHEQSIYSRDMKYP